MTRLGSHKDWYPKVKRDLAVLKWMVGVNLAASLSIVIKLFV